MAILIHPGLLLAALLTVGLGLAHSWLGERWLIRPILDGPSAGILKRSRLAPRTLRFAWHLTSLAWWGLALILAALASFPLVGNRDRVVLAIIATTFLVTGAVVLISSRGRHLAWPIFLGIAGLTALPVLQVAP